MRSRAADQPGRLDFRTWVGRGLRLKLQFQLRPRLAWTERTYVSADVPGGQASGAETRDHQMREILAHSAPIAQHLRHGRRNRRLSRSVFETAIQLRHQLFRAGEDRAPLRKALVREVRKHLLHAHV